MNQEAIIGTWISADKSDTLDFVNNESFYKSNEVMRYDHYDYELFGDAIKIRYSGKLYILVSPTVHSFNLSENKLTIDFSNEQCYGFNQEKVDYFKNEWIWDKTLERVCHARFLMSILKFTLARDMVI